MHEPGAFVQSAVFICKGPCIGAERHVRLHSVCACVQSRMFICTSTCTWEVRKRREEVFENLRNLSACVKVQTIFNVPTELCRSAGQTGNVAHIRRLGILVRGCAHVAEGGSF